MSTKADTMEWIRKSYDVPARAGGRVEYTGGDGPALGTITSATIGGLLRIRLDGTKHPRLYHPTWKLRYLPEVESSHAE